MLFIVEENKLADINYFGTTEIELDIVFSDFLFNHSLDNYKAYAISINMLKNDAHLCEFFKMLYLNKGALIYLYAENEKKISNYDINEIFAIKQLTINTKIIDAGNKIVSTTKVMLGIDYEFDIISISKDVNSNFLATVYFDNESKCITNEYISLIYQDYITVELQNRNHSFDIVDDGYDIRAYYNDNYYNVNYFLYKAHNSSTTNDYFGLLTYISSYIANPNYGATKINIKHKYSQQDNHIWDAQPASTIKATTLSCQISLNGPSVGFSYDVSNEPTVDRVYNINENSVSWVIKNEIGNLNNSYFVLGSSHSVPKELAEAKIEVKFQGVFTSATGVNYVTPEVNYCISYRYCTPDMSSRISHDFGSYTRTVTHHSAFCTYCGYFIKESHQWIHTPQRTYCGICSYISNVQPWSIDNEES